MKMTFPVPEDLLNFELEISPDEGEETHIRNCISLWTLWRTYLPYYLEAGYKQLRSVGGEGVGRSALCLKQLESGQPWPLDDSSGSSTQLFLVVLPDLFFVIIAAFE